jgi:hypothetical protein|tara:strand:+ start:4515 stop:4907 length:393 start_codon:yes stop_codon:yes gene_type:complete
MADTLTLGGTATATLVGAWELRAGSQSTTEWLDGAADVAYPGNLGGFVATNSDGANGYDPAPKLALINVTGGADGETIILSGGASAILSVTATPAEATPVLTGCIFSGLTATLQYASGSANVTTVMVLYN